MTRALPFALTAVASLSLVWCGGQYSDAPESDAGSASESSDSAASAFDATTSADGSPGPTEGGAAEAGATDAGVSHDASVIDASPPSKDASTTDAGVVLAWEALTFAEVKAFGTCTGARYVAFNSKYNLWVGVIRCSATQYKIHLSATRTGKYYEVADGANSGEDHCELVNPSFASNDFSSCPTCAISGAYGGAGDAPAVGVYTRSYPGEAFVFNTKWPTNNYYTPSWYKCAVSIP